MKSERYQKAAWGDRIPQSPLCHVAEGLATHAQVIKDERGRG